MQLFSTDIFGVLRFIDHFINNNTFAALDTQYIATEAKIALTLADFNIEALLNILHMIVVFAKHGFELCWG